MIYLEMIGYLLLLLVLLCGAGMVFYILIKRFSIAGLVKGVLQGLAGLGTAVLAFFRTGAEADAYQNDESGNEDTFVIDADTYDADGCFKDKQGNIYL